MDDSHLIPAIIRKVYEAKLSGQDVVLWGDGSPLREFTYSEDLAKIIVLLLEKYDGRHPINAGNTAEYSVKTVAHLIAEILEYSGDFKWDTTKPLGQLRKPSDNSKVIEIGWNSDEYTSLKTGLEATCEWFTEHYPNVRGIE